MTNYMCFVLSLILLSGSENAFSQINEEIILPKHYKQLQFSTGYFNYGSIDELYYNNVYAGSNIHFGFAYTKPGATIINRTALRIAMLDRTANSLVLDNTVLEPDHYLRNLKSFHLEINDVYLYPLHFPNVSFLKLYLAGSWFTSFNLMVNHQFNPELLLSTLAPGILIESVFRRHGLMTHFSFSIFSLSCRNNYSTSLAQDYEDLKKLSFVIENTKMQLPNSFKGLFLTIGYRYLYSERINFDLSYDFRYFKDNIPRLLRSVNGIYSLGLTYKLFTK